ncbi:hypothetical protein ZWY2020_050255 [Hordeum vulgare]|nr:hypothetical protein ZWY2020_050255 [Hordeum vulgare]
MMPGLDGGGLVPWRQLGRIYAADQATASGRPGFSWELRRVVLEGMTWAAGSRSTGWLLCVPACLGGSWQVASGDRGSMWGFQASNSSLPSQQLGWVLSLDKVIGFSCQR